MLRLAHAVSTLGPLGRTPRAPGTAAAAATAIVGYASTETMGAVSVFVLAGVLAGVGQWAVTVRRDAEDDPPEVVIDESAGQCMAMMGLGPDAVLIGVSFILFRLFDIWKPWPIRRIQDHGGKWAVMGDDIVAGLMARLVLLVAGVW